MKARHVSAGETYATNSESRRAAPWATNIPTFSFTLYSSTKNRESLIPPELQPKLHAYISGIGKNKQIPIIAVGGTGNDVHVLIALPSDISVSKAVQLLKANSSRWFTNQPQHHARRSFDEEFASLLREAGVAFDTSEFVA